ncbi:MAG: dockerin type I repeat-containing protein [Ruminococcus sp.]
MDQDGICSLTDLVLLQQYLLNQKLLTEQQTALADLSADQTVNGMDLVLLTAGSAKHCAINNKNLSSQAYTRVFSANFVAYCVKNACRATARLRILPCLQQNYARKSTYISCEDSSM